MKSRLLICTTVMIFFAALTVPIRLAAQSAWTFTNVTPLPEARGFHGTSAVYDPSSNRMTIFGGRKSTISGPTLGNMNDVWVLTKANGVGSSQWINLIPDGSAGSPPQRSGHSAVYDAVNNRMIIFGGCSVYCTPTLNDVWVLSNANGLGGTPAWQQLFPTGGPPPARIDFAAAYDQINNRMIIYGGQNGGGGCCIFTDVWVLANANGLGGTLTWTQLSPAGGGPSGGYGARAVYDATNNILTEFGGSSAAGQLPNAVWTLSNANGLGGAPVWTNIVLSSTTGSPAGRAFHTTVYDPASNRMTMFGGGGVNTLFNDVWVLSNANGLGGTPRWMRLIPTGAPNTGPTVREGHTAVYDPGTNRMTIFSGYVYANDQWGNGTYVLSDANGQ